MRVPGALVVVLDQPFEHACADGHLSAQVGMGTRTGMLLSPWQLRACPEACGTVSPPSYLVVEKGASSNALDDIMRPRAFLNADLRLEAKRWGDGASDEPNGDLEAADTACCGHQTIAAGAKTLFAGAYAYFADKAAQAYEMFTGSDGEVRRDESRPFEHRTRWEDVNDPYRK